MGMNLLFLDFKKTYDSVSREVLYNVLNKFGIAMKLISIIKLYLNESCSRFCVGKNLSDMFPIRNGLTQGDSLSSLLQNLL
jgi:hypothetical protein